MADISANSGDPEKEAMSSSINKDKSKERIVLIPSMTMMRMYLVNKRQDMDMSIRETSRVLDMDVHHYRRIEQGHIAHVGFITFCRIADVLDISLNELYEMELVYQKERGGDDG